MSTETNNQEVPVTPEVNGGEKVENIPTVEELQTRLKDMEATVGSTKRELKDARQALEDAKKALTPIETPQQTPQSSEPDYAKLGFLNSVQVNNPDDQKMVMDEASRLKLPLTDVLQMEHVKTRLEANKNQRLSQEGMPNGKGRKDGTTKGEVEYYIQHPDEVPEDLELHEKVINARMKKIENDSKFSNVPVIG